MKITQAQLRRIIKEELESLREDDEISTQDIELDQKEDWQKISDGLLTLSPPQFTLNVNGKPKSYKVHNRNGQQLVIEDNPTVDLSVDLSGEDPAAALRSKFDEFGLTQKVEKILTIDQIATTPTRHAPDGALALISKHFKSSIIPSYYSDFVIVGNKGYSLSFDYDSRTLKLSKLFKISSFSKLISDNPDMLSSETKQKLGI